MHEPCYPGPGAQEVNAPWWPLTLCFTRRCVSLTGPGSTTASPGDAAGQTVPRAALGHELNGGAGR